MTKVSILPNLAGGAAIAGWIFSALIVVLTGTIPPMLLSALICGGSFIICLAYWIATKQSIRQKFMLSRKAYALGTFGVCGYTVLWLIGLKTAPAFEATALIYTWPLLLVIFSARLDKIALSLSQKIGVTFGLIGSTIIFTRYSIGEINPTIIFGFLCAIMAAVVWASYSCMTKYMPLPSDSVGIFLLITGIISYGLHLGFESNQPVDFASINWLMVALLACSRVSFIMWDYAMKNGDRQMLGSSAYLIPAFSVLLLGIFSDTEVTAFMLTGVVIIVIGCLLSNGEKIISAIKQLQNT